MQLTTLQKTCLIESIDETIFFLEDLKTILRECNQEETLIYNISLSSKRVNVLHILLNEAVKYIHKKNK